MDSHVYFTEKLLSFFLLTFGIFLIIMTPAYGKCEEGKSTSFPRLTESLLTLRGRQAGMKEHGSGAARLKSLSRDGSARYSGGYCWISVMRFRLFGMNRSGTTGIALVFYACIVDGRLFFIGDEIT